MLFGRTVRKAHAHAAEPNGRDFQAASSESALLHFVFLILCLKPDGQRRAA
jgi:hypothetical protein